MARKKVTKAPIVNGLDDAYIVEKSRPLMLMKEVPFALGELKILDTYLSRINARDDSSRTVRFTKEEYEDLMGVERMRPERLEKYVRSIMSKTVTVPDKKTKGGWRIYTLFEEAECGPDENDQWWVDLTCTAMAKKLFFNLDSIGYIRYQLKNVLPLTSKYSVLLYIYLLDNRFRRSWTVSLEDFRSKVLRCDSEYYQDFKYFKRDILDKSIKEVNAKTDLTFSYETTRTGKRVSGIQFTLVKDEVTLPLEQDPAQLKIEDFDVDEESVPDIDDPLAMSISVLPKELTREEVQLLHTLAQKYVPYEVASLYEKQMWISDYLQEKVLQMKAQRTKVKHPFSWLKKAVEEDWH